MVDDMNENENIGEGPDATVSTLEALKQEATELGIAFSPNIAEKTLAARIEKFYEDQEVPAVTAALVAAGEAQTPEEIAAEADQSMRSYARKMEAEARKTRIVTITDNDQRINNATTTCTANCSNNYFDLGTIVLPLNERVEVRQGHLEALAGVRIPHHVRSAADPSISATVMRPRYAIHYESVDK